MCHSQSVEDMKEKIRSDMTSASGKIRVLLCTSAAGMGVNFEKVNYIVHYGSPRDVDMFVQQIGRAGRDGSQSHHALIYSKRQLMHVEHDIINYVKTEVCRGAAVMASYSGTYSAITGHLCCDNCQKIVRWPCV